MIVSDPTALRYLVALGLVERLALRFETVIVPERVIAELSHPHAPEDVRVRAINPPEWVRVLAIAPVVVPGLDPGESEAIALAESLGTPLLLDETRARREAHRRGIAVVGTLSFIAFEAKAGRLDYDEVTERLLRLGFRARPELVAALRPA